MDLLATAWTDLALANYAIDPAVLAPHVPAGTELDTYDGVAYVSVVGFVWTEPRLWGLPAPPLHERFAELNLRTYVRRARPDCTLQRGVVFLKEIVGSPLVAWVGRDVYHENFALARVEMTRLASDEVAYHWYRAGSWERFTLKLGADPAPAPVPPAFFLDRTHAFTRRRDGTTAMYAVARSSGVVRGALASLDADVGALYGASYREALGSGPVSAFWAAGSPVKVAWGEVF